jgi:hypothetical protein
MFGATWATAWVSKPPHMRMRTQTVKITY